MTTPDIPRFLRSLFPWLSLIVNAVASILFCFNDAEFLNLDKPIAGYLFLAALFVLSFMCGLSLFRDPIRCQNKDYDGIGKFLFYFIAQGVFALFLLAIMCVYHIWLGMVVLTILLCAEIIAAVLIIRKYRYTW